MSYYKILNIPITATDEDVRNGYRQSVLRAHPDKGGTAQMFKNIQDAYNILRDTEKRRKYDDQLSQLRMQKKFSKSSYCPTAMTTTIKTPLAFPLMNGTQYIFETAPDQLKCRFRHGDVVQNNTGKQTTNGVPLSQTGTFIGKASNGFYWRKDGESYASLLFTEGFGRDRDVSLVYRASSSLNSTGSNFKVPPANDRGTTATTSTTPSSFKTNLRDASKKTSSNRPATPKSSESTNNIPKRRSYSTNTTTGVSGQKENHIDPHRAFTPNAINPSGVSRDTKMRNMPKATAPRPSPAPSRGNLHNESTPNGVEKRSKSTSQTGSKDGESHQESRRRMIKEARIRQIGINMKRLIVLEEKKREEIEGAVNKYIATFFSTVENILKASKKRMFQMRSLFPSSNLKTFSSVGVLLKGSNSSDAGDSASNSGLRIGTPKRAYSASSTPRTTTLFRSPSASTMASTVASNALNVENPPSNRSSNHYLYPPQKNLHLHNVHKVSLAANPTTATFSGKYGIKESPTPSYATRRSNSITTTDSTKLKSTQRIGRNTENISDVISVTSSATSRSKRCVSESSLLKNRSEELNRFGRGRSIPKERESMSSQAIHSNHISSKSLRDISQQSTDAQKQNRGSSISRNDKAPPSECGSSPSTLYKDDSQASSNLRAINARILSATFQKGLNSSRNPLPYSVLEQIHSKERLMAMPEEEGDSCFSDHVEGMEVTAQSLIAASSPNERSKSVEPPVVARKYKPQTKEVFNVTPIQNSGSSTGGSVMWSNIGRSSDSTSPIDIDGSNVGTTVSRTKPLSFGLSKSAVSSSTPRVSFAIDGEKKKVQEELPSINAQQESEKEDANAGEVEENRTMTPSENENIDDDICDDQEEHCVVADKRLNGIKSPTITVTPESAQFLKNIYLQKNGNGKEAKKSALLEMDEDLETKCGKVTGLQPLEVCNGGLDDVDTIPFAPLIASSTSKELSSLHRNIGNLSHSKHKEVPNNDLETNTRKTPQLLNTTASSPTATATVSTPVSILKNGYNPSISYSPSVRSRSGGFRSQTAAPPPVVTLRKAVSVA